MILTKEEMKMEGPINENAFTENARTNEIKNTRQFVFIVFPFDINKYY